MSFITFINKIKKKLDNDYLVFIVVKCSLQKVSEIMYLQIDNKIKIQTNDNNKLVKIYLQHVERLEGII